MEKLHEFYQKNILTDLEITAKNINTSLRVHGVVLASKSEHFAFLLTNDNAESKQRYAENCS